MSADHVSDLESQIEQTRSELADTVEALAQKADVKGRAKDKAQDVAHSVQEKAHDVAHSVQEKAHDVAHSAQEKAHDVAHSAQENAHDVAQGAQEKAGEATEKAGAAVIRLDETRADRPWLLPALGAAAGLSLAGAVFAVIRRRRR